MALWLTFPSRAWLLIAWLTLCMDYPWTTEGCPGLCTCTMKNSNGDDPISPAQRIICSEKSAISSLAQLELDKLQSNTYLLDLSQNSLTTIHKGSFLNLNALQKLNLANNKINIIEPGAFAGLAKLEKLDLSGNKLTSINKTILEGMPKLERLSLSGNELKGIPDGTFSSLPALKRLDFESAYLMCDCHLGWILKWLKNNNIRLNSGTKCSVPSELKNRPVKALKKKDLHCDWPVELPRFELIPDTNQVVFKGDELKFLCRASVIEETMKMFWVRKDVAMETNATLGIATDSRFSPDKSEMTSALQIDSLDVEDSGIWKCFVLTSRGNVTKDVNIVVMSEDTIYCPARDTANNKGTFNWPKIVSGVRAHLVCPHGASSSYVGNAPPQAFYNCDNDGRWTDLDTSQCQFESEVTRVLEQYAKRAELTNMSRAMTRADELKVYINNAKIVTDKMDIIYLSAIVENLSQQVRSNEKLSSIILDIVSIVMRSDPKILGEAQMENQACTRMIRAVEELPKQLLSAKRPLITQHADNIAFFAHTVNPEKFQGMSCAALRPTNPKRTYSDSSFFCSPQQNFTYDNPAKYMRIRDKEVEAFIHVPATIFQTVKCVYPVCSDNMFTLQFITYRNGRLFPILHRHSFHRLQQQITTSVISAKIVGVSVVENLTDPLVVSLVSRRPGIRRTAAYWDFLMQDGWGGWDTQGCSVLKEDGNITTMTCTHMTNYAVLQTPVLPGMAVGVWYLYMFTLPPAVYAGSGILVLCAVAVICTIAGCHRDMKMPSKSKHSIANLCLSLLLLTLTFTLGVRMTVHVMACQIIGIALHYFSICTFFWILITSYNMYKKFVKAERPSAPPIEPMEGPPVPKPMLRFYLIGWGIAIIICGITAAVNLKYYADRKPYCFLSMEPSVGAIIVPACILIFINVIFFICICCIVRGHGSPALDEPETEEINDLELTNQDIESLPQSHASNLTAATSMMDLEYRPVSQLRAIAAVLLLYLLTWVCGAFVVALPFPNGIPYQETIFTYLYAVFSATLGIFLLVFYCLGREDARENWKRCFKCDRPQPYTITSTGGHLTHMNGHIANSHTSLNSSFTNKSSNTNHSQHVRAGQKKTSNMNLVPAQSHPATLTEVSLTSTQQQEGSVPIFYNPRQNGIAKRYWEKHRQKNHLNLLHKDHHNSDNRSVHSNHTSVANSNINRQSYQGNSSDANTHLSIEIQIKSRPRSGAYSPKLNGSDHNNYNSLPRSQRSGYSPLTVPGSNHTPLLMPVSGQLARSQMTPVGGPLIYKGGTPAGVHGVDPMPISNQDKRFLERTDGVNIIAPHLNGYYVPPSSVAVYPSLPPPPSYAYPANSVSSSNGGGSGLLGGSGSNNTLPRSGAKSSHPLLPRNGSVPRLRDIDGQSQVSSSNASRDKRDRLPSVSSDIQNMEMYTPPIPPVINILPQGKVDSADTAEEEPQPPGPVDLTEELAEAGKLVSNTPSDCGTNSSRRRKKESFMDQLEQRIPHNKMGSSPALSRSTLGGSLDRATRSRPTSMGSENSQHSGQSQRSQSHTSAFSETDSHSRPHRSRSHDSHESNKSSRESHQSRESHHSRDSRHSRPHRRHRGKRSSRSLPSKESTSWEASQELKERPKQPAYAYVNHSYQEKVMNKLLQQNPNGMVEPIARGLSWFPRSVSAYEQVANVDDLDDDSTTSSSSDDSTDDIWVLQKKKKKKFKKETSV